METSELIKKVREVEIKTRGLSTQLFSGEYQSAFKGRGMSFSEVREYTYGDDVRNIDWNVTARTSEPHVKVFEEERELSVLLIIDISGSTFTGYHKEERIGLMTELSAVLSFSALQNNDKVGLLMFSDKIHRFLTPKKGKKHILRIIRELVKTPEEGGSTDINTALKYVNNFLKKRAVIFILSDFYAEPAAYKDSLKILSRRHDVVGIHFSDRWDEKLPHAGLLPVIDKESGETYVIDTESSKVREQHHAQFQKKRKELPDLFRASGGDYLHLRLGEDYTSNLLQFFKQRR